MTLDQRAFLTHLLRDPTHVALSGPTDDDTLGRWWGPSPCAAAEIPGLIAQHMTGAIYPRMRWKGKDERRRLVLERDALWLGAYSVHRDADGAPWCWWLCLDCDVAGGGHAKGLTQAETDALAKAIVALMQEAGLCPILERSHSGRGWHIWCLFSERIPGPMAEWLAALIAATAARQIGLPDTVVIESFPKNGNPDTLGSLVALPLTGAPRGPGGGEILTKDIDLVPVSVIDEKRQLWTDALAAEEALAAQQKRQAEEKRQRWLASGKTASVDFDRISCEDVVAELASDRITEKTNDEYFMNCPRHESRSKRSLTVQRGSPGKWYCFGCNKGGGSFLLARFLLGENTKTADIFAQFDTSEAS